MRKSFNGLYAIAKHELERNPTDGSLFVFANRRRGRIKVLYWDGSGFWVLAKRLEKGTFWWPSPAELAGKNELEIKPAGFVHALERNRSEGGSMRPWFCR